VEIAGVAECYSWHLR